jgi:hypothetical protein
MPHVDSDTSAAAAVWRVPGGLAFQDAIVAWSVYAAPSERRVGTKVSFLD